jgi:hypothetical protein
MLCLYVLMQTFVCNAQTITPCPSLLNETARVYLYGLGAVAVDDIAANPSAALTLRVRPADWASVFLIFNRGAGLTEVGVDTFDVGGIFFPQANNSSFLVSLPLAYRIVDSVNKEMGYDVGGLLEYVRQGHRPIRAEVAMPFTSDMIVVGGRFAWSYFADKQPRMRLIVDANWTTLHVNSKSEDNFRTVFGDSLLPTTYSGWGFQVGAQINALTATFGYKNIGISDGRFIDGFSGSTALLSFAVAGEIFGF